MPLPERALPRTHVSLGAAAPESGQAPSLTGKVLGGTYRVLRKLDEGGMGVVLEALHLRLQRRVAVKLLAPRLATNPDMVARFREEARIVSRLDHPHVVTLLDFDVSDSDEAYLVFELLRGETLEERLDAAIRVPLVEACEIVAQLADALSAVHRAGVVHRDVKPANVFLTHAPDEPTFVKLLDFGVSSDVRSRASARLTRSGALIGTPEYMAPEQTLRPSSRAPVGERADQHALALLAYEMLTGEQPFAHGKLAEVLERVKGLHPVPASEACSDVPREVDAVLARALAKDPAARFPDVTSFARALTAAVRSATGEPVPVTAATDMPPRERRRTASETLASAVHPATTRGGPFPLRAEERRLSLMRGATTFAGRAVLRVARVPRGGGDEQSAR